MGSLFYFHVCSGTMLYTRRALVRTLCSVSKQRRSQSNIAPSERERQWTNVFDRDQKKKEESRFSDALIH